MNPYTLRILHRLLALLGTVDTFGRGALAFCAAVGRARRDTSDYTASMNTESDPDIAEGLIGQPDIVFVGEAERRHGDAHRKAGGAAR